jgi:hypothetical protein
MLQKVIVHCFEDMNILAELIFEEQDKQVRAIFEYHFRLDIEIIKAIKKGELIKAAALFDESKRSTILSAIWIEKYASSPEGEEAEVII